MISSTSTVIIAIVMRRFVAILPPESKASQSITTTTESRTWDILPSRHAPQRLDTPVNIPLTLQQIPMRVLNDIPLLVQVRQRTRADLLRLQRYPLRLTQPV